MGLGLDYIFNKDIKINYVIDYVEVFEGVDYFFIFIKGVLIICRWLVGFIEGDWRRIAFFLVWWSKGLFRILSWVGVF